MLASFAVGAVALPGFVAWESHSDHPMLPMRLFRGRAFAAVNSVSLLMKGFKYSGFGGHHEPACAVFPWSGHAVLVAPPGGAPQRAAGGAAVLASGLALQAAGLAWLALRTSPSVPYSDLWPAFVVSGLGMALFFVPLASVLGAHLSVRGPGEGSRRGQHARPS